MRIRDLPILLALAALPLSGCATIFNSKNCSSVLSGLSSADAIVTVLLERGFETERAKSIANLILLGRLSAEAVCAANAVKVNAAPLPAPADEPASAEPLARAVLTSR